MTTPEAQKIFATTRSSRPTRRWQPSEEVAAWGKFVADTLPVEVAKRQAEAIRMMDRAGWN
jgi:iron(III) transport system substrate-binding protein